MQVVPVADEARIRPHADRDVGVPSLTTPDGGMSCPAHANVLPVVDPGRNVHVELPPRDDTPFAAAHLAGILEHAPFA